VAYGVQGSAIRVLNAVREVLNLTIGVPNATRGVVELGDWGSERDARSFLLGGWSSELDA